MTTFVNVFDQLASIALVVRKAPSTLLRRAYVKAYRDWCAETRWLRDTIPGQTVANTVVYDLGSDPYLEIISVRAASCTPLQGAGVSTPRTLPLQPQDSSLWDPNAQASRPQRYCYIPEGQIAFYPTPDAVYDMLVTVALQPKDGVAQVPSEPLKKYSTGIEAGALMHLLRIPGQPWTDLKMAEKYEAIWNSCVSNGKADVQRAYNEGSQRARPRPFVMGR